VKIDCEFSKKYVKFHKMKKITIKLKTIPQEPIVPVSPVPDPESSPPIGHLCDSCHEYRTEYYDGYTTCKVCIRLRQRERNKQARLKQKEIYADPVASSKPKDCASCGKTKTVKDFRINRSECHDCERAYGRQYNREHAEKRKCYREMHKEEIHKIQAEWYQINKVHVQNKYNARIESDPEFKLKKKEKDKLHRVIDAVFSQKGCTNEKTDRISDWLEYNFTDPMEWENHGTLWDIDHVIPLGKWDLTNPTHVEMCFDWKNLSPLDCKTNRFTKRAQINTEQVTQHTERLKQYFEENGLDMKELNAYMEKYNQHLQSMGETP